MTQYENIEDELARIDTNIEGIHGRLNRYSEMYVEEDMIKEDLETLSQLYEDISGQVDILASQLQVIKDEVNNIKRAKSAVNDGRRGENYTQELT
jgi:archaellum component FlaC